MDGPRALPTTLELVIVSFQMLDYASKITVDALWVNALVLLPCSCIWLRRELAISFDYPLHLR